MSYFTVVTFDLNHKASVEDYTNAYADLAKLGLSKFVKGTNGSNTRLPNTTVVGELTGISAAAVRDIISQQVQTMFAARGFNSEIFVSVGGDWAWGHRTTGKK